MWTITCPLPIQWAGVLVVKTVLGLWDSNPQCTVCLHRECILWGVQSHSVMLYHYTQIYINGVTLLPEHINNYEPPLLQLLSISMEHDSIQHRVQNFPEKQNYIPIANVCRGNNHILCTCHYQFFVPLLIVANML